MDPWQPKEAPAGAAPRTRRALLSWILYDAASNSFPLVIITAVYVLYFKQVVVPDVGKGDLLWGLCLSTSALLVALTAPFMGALADARAWRKRLLGVYTALACISTLFLGFSGEGMVLWAMTFVILGNATYEGTNAFYASLLPSVAAPSRLGRISGYGWAAGYLGGLVVLAASLPFAMSGAMRVVIFLVAAWFALLSLPLFFFVPEPPARAPAGDAAGAAARRGMGQVWENVKACGRAIAKERGLLVFFIAYFVYNDAIITTFAFAAPFATEELFFSNAGIIGLILGIQVSGAVGAFTLGHLADRIGNIRTVMLTLALMFCASLVAFWCAREVAALGPGLSAALIDDPESAEGARIRTLQGVFSVVGLGFGLMMGAAQAASRSFLASVTPPSQAGELFGFYGLVGRFSAVLGPILFGGISFLTGSKAWSVLSLTAMFAIGLLLLSFVPERALRAKVGP